MKSSQQILIISNFYKIKLCLTSLGLASLFLRSKLYWKSNSLKSFEEQLTGEKLVTGTTFYLIFHSSKLPLYSSFFLLYYNHTILHSFFHTSCFPCMFNHREMTLKCNFNMQECYWYVIIWFSNAQKYCKYL